MQSVTHHLFRRAILGDVNVTQLLLAKQHETPYAARRIDTLIQPPVHTLESDARFGADFTKEPVPRHRLDQVVLAYLMFFATHLQHEHLNRAFVRPTAWHGMHTWIYLYKRVAFSVLTLAYNLRWDSTAHLLLEEAVGRLLVGDAEAFHTLFRHFKIHEATRVSDDDFFRLGRQSAYEFGPYYWRLIHFMATAMDVRGDEHPDIVLAKRLWRDFTMGSMYRTLRCSFCMDHYRKLVSEYKTQLSNRSDYGRVWFEVHNRVNAANGKPLYSESEYEQDVKFMELALRP